MKYILVISSAFVVFCAAQRPPNTGSRNVDPNVENFKIFKFAQQWPQSACWNINERWNETICTDCTLPNSTVWTIHGLWPSNKKGRHPTFCSEPHRFSWELISSHLRQELNEMWPTFKLHAHNDGFWRYEWRKHGSCATSLESTNSIPKYFLKALQLYRKYEVGPILRERNIVPGKEYNLIDVLEAIRETLGVLPFIDCAKNKDTGKQYLMQVYFCLDKEFNLINCDENGHDVSSCKRKLKVDYPSQLGRC